MKVPFVKNTELEKMDQPKRAPHNVRKKQNPLNYWQSNTLSNLGPLWG
jgi:hypothetical protein